MSTTCRIVTMPRNDARFFTWYHQPVLWLGVVVFVASMAGCVWLIVVSSRHADIPVDTSHTVFGVPVGSRSSSGASP